MARIDPGRSLRLAAGLIAAILVGGAGSAEAAQAMAAPLYGDPSHPNISGMWNPEFVFLGPPPPGAGPPRPPGPPPGGPPGGGPPRAPPMPELTPAYAAKFAAWRKKFEVGEQEPDSVTRCLAFGLARFGTMPMEIIQTPGQVTLNLGVLHDIRRIYMDGVGHTVGAEPSFNGDSVGRWEGDVLVVETNNVRAGTVDRSGVPYSDKLTAVERYRLVSPDRIEVETTLTDPEAFVTPFTLRRAYVRMPRGSRFEEYLCENNKDA